MVNAIGSSSCSLLACCVRHRLAGKRPYNTAPGPRTTLSRRTDAPHAAETFPLPEQALHLNHADDVERLALAPPRAGTARSSGDHPAPGRPQDRLDPPPVRARREPGHAGGARNGGADAAAPREAGLPHHSRRCRACADPAFPAAPALPEATLGARHSSASACGPTAGPSAAPDHPVGREHARLRFPDRRPRALPVRVSAPRRTAQVPGPSSLRGAPDASGLRVVPGLRVCHVRRLPARRAALRRHPRAAPRRPPGVAAGRRRRGPRVPRNRAEADPGRARPDGGPRRGSGGAGAPEAAPVRWRRTAECGADRRGHGGGGRLDLEGAGVAGRSGRAARARRQVRIR